MIFESLAEYIKKYMNTRHSIKPLLFKWMKEKLESLDLKDKTSRIIKAEFCLSRVQKNEKVSFIVPKSGRASFLLKLLQEYINVMEETRLERLANPSATEKKRKVKVKK